MLGRSKCKVGLDKNDFVLFVCFCHIWMSHFSLFSERIASVQTGLAMDE